MTALIVIIWLISGAFVGAMYIKDMVTLNEKLSAFDVVSFLIFSVGGLASFFLYLCVFYSDKIIIWRKKK